MSQAAFVKSADIKSAVKDRETEILDALSINWWAGRSHINCPYPQHNDNTPSWRWDEQAACARCTCSKSDSVFDVIMKVEGIDFEAAKRRVAQIIGRDDLVKEKALEGKSFQKTDAVSLLNPPIQERDDSLPCAYLAYRLGVEPETVPIPTTLVAGWKALVYFDPPPVHKGRGRPPKPVHVGDFPCAIFGTVNAEGKSHAHRIYVAPEGVGKADLGAGADGTPRNPKKSARVTGDQSTAGLSVVWGDAWSAGSILLCEGIETGASLAVAFRKEIEAKKIAVAAAISANGVEAFKPWPNTNNIVICADRDDEAKPNGQPGSQRGESAARNLGLRLHQTHSIYIALPGICGETVDWLDIHCRHGSETVRRGVRAAEVFAPSETERQQEASKSERQRQLQEITKAYPLPSLETLKLTYRHAQDGTVKVHKMAGVDTDPVTGRSEPTWIPIATPFGIPARLRFADQADAYGLRVVVQDMEGRPRELDLDRTALAKMAGAEIRSMLFGAGLRTEADGELTALQCLKGADPAAEIIVVHQPGWHAVPGRVDPVFVCPDGDVIGLPDSLKLELARYARMTPEVARSGTLDGWQDAVSAALTMDGTPHWTLGIIAAFTGPVLSLTGLDTCGINLSGMSSAGKSTAQRLAASAWSTPDIRKPGLCQSARATDNAIEALAFRATGTVLSLDELGHVSGKAVGKMIYTIAGGIGKKRMTSDAMVRDGFSWSTFAILSGECSLAEKILADGGEWLAGMAVRIVDIDVTEINRRVDGKTLQQIARIDAHHGHAGPQFVRALIEAGYHRQAEALRGRILRKAQELSGQDADSARIRAATPFALLQIAGDLACEFDVILSAIDVNSAVLWGWERFCQSFDATALEPEDQAIANIRSWFAERWNVTIKPLDCDGGINNREAVAWHDETTLYLPRARLREAADGVLKETAIADALHRRGLLTRQEDRHRRYVRYVPKIGKVEAYALKRSEFGRTGLHHDPDRLHVYEGGQPIGGD